MILNRRVTKTVSSIKDDKRTSGTFEEFLDIPNIILLGDPGSGKSTVFEKAKEYETANIFTARNFLIYSTSSLENKIVYIDALDEKRSRSNTQDNIDGIIQRLVEIKPLKVRISCRALDWLGETDLALFKPYFESTGGYVVLQLNELSEFEQIEILANNDIGNPDLFLQNAHTKGLKDLLNNPQTLIMLLTVVKENVWPESRSELFEEAIKILLKEHNANHRSSNLPIENIIDAAGAVCAVQLISDSPYISLLSSGHDSNYPSYDTVPFDNAFAVLTALSRRAFQSISDEVATYSHRTIAEFLAAKWIAQKIKMGLPLSRIISIICSEEYPASELRGMYAWLPIFLFEHANQIIKNDPIGILMYGDAKVLTSEKRHFLLSCIEKYAEKDPWFREWDSNIEILGSLSGPDMSLAFKKILNLPLGNHHIRTLVLDAISCGPQMPDMENELVNIFQADSDNYTERSAALSGILNAIPNGAEIVIQITKNTLLLRSKDSQLCANVLSRLYKGNFTSKDVVKIITDVLRDRSRRPFGEIWALKKIDFESDLPSLLDEISAISIDADRIREDKSEISSLYSHWLFQYLSNQTHLEIYRVWIWLTFFWNLERTHIFSNEDPLRKWFFKNPTIVKQLFNEAWNKNNEKNINSFWFTFRNSVLDVCNINEYFYYFLESSENLNNSKDMREGAFKFLLDNIFYLNSPDIILFQLMTEVATKNEELNNILTASCYMPIDCWQHTDAVSAIKRNREEEINKQKQLGNFDSVAKFIATGANSGWLTHASKIYFHLFYDTDNSPIKIDRVKNELGHDRASIVVEGLKQLVIVEELAPSFEQILNTHNKGQYNESWYAVLAGIDIIFNTEGNLDSIPESSIKTVLAIDLFLPVFDKKENTTIQIQHAWISTIYKQKKALAFETLKTLAENDLRRKLEYSAALNRLKHEEEFNDYTSEMAIDLLDKYPQSVKSLTKILLVMVSSDTSQRNNLQSLVEKKLKSRSVLDRPIWKIFSFFYFSKNFHDIAQLIESQKDNEIFVDIKSAITEYEIPLASLSSDKISFLIMEIGSKFPLRDSPKNGWVGDNHPFDFCQFVRGLIAQLSKRTDLNSSQHLNILSERKSLSSYKNLIKHSLANQITLRRQSQYAQPTWDQTVKTLTNKQPANMTDLLALTMNHIRTTEKRIRNNNIDSYKLFWNEDSNGKHALKPKAEESARDVLIGLLRENFARNDVRIEPEGHMAEDKRADAVLYPSPARKLPLELKRDYHRDVWSACENQLERLYTRDPESDGYGLYLVFWYGEDRPKPIPKPPRGMNKPSSAVEMENLLTSLIPESQRSQLKVIVLDVSKPI